jgi:hypothetical protein
MRQAILTSYHGPTDRRGAVIRAKAQGGSLTMPYPHELNHAQRHPAAAHALAVKMAGQGGRGWCGYWSGGGMPSAKGCCWVRIGDTNAVPDNTALGVENEDWFWVHVSAAAPHENR